MNKVYNLVNHTKGIEVFTHNQEKAYNLAACMVRANSADLVNVYSYWDGRINPMYKVVFMA